MPTQSGGHTWHLNSEELIECVQLGKDSEIDQKVYNIKCGTHEGRNEVERGWGEGPYTEDEISAILGDDRWVASEGSESSREKSVAR